MNPELIAALTTFLAFLPIAYAYGSALLAVYSMYLALSGTWQGVPLWRSVMLVALSFGLLRLASAQLGWE